MKKRIFCKYLFNGKNVSENECVTIDKNKIVSIHKCDTEIIVDDFEHENQDMYCYFLMPGLIDAHVHITGYNEKFLGINPYLPIENFLKLLISRGITSVRDTGNSIEAIQYAKKWCMGNYNITIASSGPILDFLPLTWQFTRIVSNAQEVKKQVDILANENVDFIKVYKNIKYDLLKNITEQADANNLYVAIDNPNINTSSQIQAGVKTIEHLSNFINFETASRNIYDKFLEIDKHQEEIERIIHIAKEKEVYCCPTILTISRLINPNLMIDEKNLDFMSTVMPYHKYLKQMQSKMGYVFGKKYMNEALNINIDAIKKYSKEKVFYNLGNLLTKLNDNKLDLIIGTDAPNPSIVPGFSLHEEMKLWKKYGISEEKILKTATSVNAKFIADNVGEIQIGMKADLLLLNSSPIEKIDNISDIKCVIVDGKIVEEVELLEQEY